MFYTEIQALDKMWHLFLDRNNNRLFKFILHLLDIKYVTMALDRCVQMLVIDFAFFQSNI